RGRGARWGAGHRLLVCLADAGGPTSPWRAGQQRLPAPPARECTLSVVRAGTRRPNSRDSCIGGRPTGRRYLEQEGGIAIQDVIGPVGGAELSHLIAAGDKRAAERLTSEKLRVEGFGECE